MFKSQIFDIIIADDDHRVLSANAEAWALVYNDVFVPIEDFVAEWDRDEFLKRLETRDGSWFTIEFEKEPGVRFFARFAEDTAVNDSLEQGNLRVQLARVDAIMDSYKESQRTLSTLGSIMGLFEDMFFEYRISDDTITFFNTDKSKFEAETVPFDDFAEQLRKSGDEETMLAIDTFINHIRQHTPRFAVAMPVNLFNEDVTVTGTMIKGSIARHGGRDESIIGLMHPLRIRGTGANAAHSYDPLTGLVNKADITQLAVDRVDTRGIKNTTIAVVDVDFFKHVNDTYGHQYGDYVLKQIAAIMEAEVGDHGTVGRIGGDEFFIVFNDVGDQDALRAHLRSIKSMVNATFRDKGPQGDKPISLSIGTATYPKDADNYSDLFTVADFCLYLAKEKGRNRYIMYTPEKHPTLEQIKNKKSDGDKLINGREDLPLGDVLTQMQFMARYGKRPSIPSLLNEFSDRFNIPLMILLTEDPYRIVNIAGALTDEAETVLAVKDKFLSPELRTPHFMKLGFVVCNDVDRLPAGYADIKEALLGIDMLSFIVIPFMDAAGNSSVMVFASLHRKIFWNEQHYMYYRLFVDTVELYDLLNALPDENIPD